MNPTPSGSLEALVTTFCMLNSLAPVSGKQRNPMTVLLDFSSFLPWVGGLLLKIITPQHGTQTCHFLMTTDHIIAQRVRWLVRTR